MDAIADAELDTAYLDTVFPAKQGVKAADMQRVHWTGRAYALWTVQGASHRTC